MANNGYKALSIIPILFALFYSKFGYYWHGTFLNPLGIYLGPPYGDPIPQEAQQWWTDLYLNNITLIPVHAEKTISKWSEVEMGDHQAGWGDNMDHALKFYKMSPELQSHLCSSWEELTEQVSNLTVLAVRQQCGKNGAHPVGCCGAIKEMRSLQDRPLLRDERIGFNSDWDLMPDIPEETYSQMDQGLLLVTSFYHDYDIPRSTATWHGSMIDSIAVQCHGEKWWTFAPPKGMAKYGAKAWAGAAIMRGTDEDVDHYLVKTTPGTILSFPAWWPHYVVSEAGPSHLYTLRVHAIHGILDLPYIAMRAFRDRMSVFNMLAARLIANGFKLLDSKSVAETVKNNDDDGVRVVMDDMNDIETCRNYLSDADFEAILEMHERVWAE